MDEEDEEKLNSIPDVKKEEILFERNQKRLNLLEKYEFIKRQRQQQERQKLIQQNPKKAKLLQVS